MKKNIVKYFSLTLAFITMLSLIASCGDTGKTDTTTAAASTSGAVTEDTTPQTDYKLDDLGTMELNETMNVLYWSDVEHEEFLAESPNGDIINDAIYTRNTNVETRLGITINWIGQDGDSGNRSAWNQKVGNSIKAGDHLYDVVAGYSLSVTLNASTGYLYNLLDEENCSYLNFEQPWWSSLLVEQATIKGKLYFASGDISRNALEMMYVCFVNKTILTDHNLENPQDLVESGDWTYDKFIEMCKGVYEGDGTKNADTDTFGYMSSGIHFDPWFYGCGATICDVDDEGNFKESDTFFSEKVINTIDKIQALTSSLDGISTSSVKHQTAFRDNRLLFCTDRARCSHKVFAENEDCTFYVVPCPKYDKDQERYYTVMGNPFTLYGIVKDCTKLTAASAFIECMASEGYRNITPAVFELSLKSKYISDATSANMYDIIRENITYDLGRLFSTDLIDQSTFRNTISGTTNNWSTIHAATSKVLKNKCKTLNAAFDKLS